MSGFELEYRSQSSRLSEMKEAAVKSSSEELNRNLLNKLKQSADIARDLSELYSDRPYVYARVMQQLGKVLGKAKVRRLHADVMSRVKMESVRRQPKQSVKPALRSASGGSDSGGKTAKGEESENEKTVMLNIPQLGLSGVELKLDTEGEQKSITSDDLPIPFLKDITGTATFADKKVNKIEFDANINAPCLENGNAHVTLNRSPGGGLGFTPSATFGLSNIVLPGLKEGVTAKFALGETAELQGTIGGTGKIMGVVSVSGSGTITTTGTDTSMSGTLTMSNAGGGDGGGAGGGARGGGAGGAAGGAASGGPMQYAGTVSLETDGTNLAGITGTLHVSNVSSLAEPSDEIQLTVGCTDAGFSASLDKAVKFAEHQYSAKGGDGAAAPAQDGGDGKDSAAKTTSVQLTINSASFTEESQLCAECQIDTKLGGLVSGKGTLNIENSKVTGGTVEVNAENVSLIDEKAFLSCNMNGSLDITEEGFSGSCTGTFTLNVNKKKVQISLDALEFDSSGNFTGKVSLAEPVPMNDMTIESLTADFSSAEGLSSANGLIRVDSPTIKSDKNGLVIKYGEDKLTADGVLQLKDVGAGGGEGKTIADCTLAAEIRPDTLAATGLFVLSKDYRVGQSQLQILAGAQAGVKFTDQGLEPLEFAGDYNYGHIGGAGGGEGGAGGGEGGAGAEGGGAEGGESESLMFHGTLSGCTFDVNTGYLNGKGSVILDSGLSFKSSKMSVDIAANTEAAETALEMTIAESALTGVSGTINYNNLTIPVEGHENLVIDGAIEGFTLDVVSGLFSGTATGKLTNPFDLAKDADGGNTMTLNAGESGIKLSITDNQLTGIKVDASVNAEIKNKIFTDGSATFCAQLKDADIDVNTFTLSTESATLTPVSAVEMGFGTSPDGQGKMTTISIDGNTVLTASISDSLIDTLSLSGGFEGETSVFGSGSPIEFTGLTGITVTDIQNAAIIDGGAGIETASDKVLDAIPDVDEITLKKGSSFGIEFNDNALTSISGDFELAYKVTAGAYKLLPNGFEASLKGDGMTYDVSSRQFSGTVTLAPSKDIEVSNSGAGGEAGGGAGQEAAGSGLSFTLVGEGTELKAEIAANKVTTLSGSAGFKANAKLAGLGSDASLDITKGQATLNIDVQGGTVSELTVSATADLDASLIDKMLIEGAGIEASATFDSTGLSEATFKGGLTMVSNKYTFIVASEEGLTYKKGSGFDGNVKVTTDKKVTLGTIKDGAYEYGLGGDSNEGSAATLTVNIEGGALSKIGGDAGLYLKEVGGAGAGGEEGSTDLLDVSGAIAFDYDVLNDSLLSASGKAIIQEKKIADVGTDSLILQKSEVTVNYEKATDLSVSGIVNLALAEANKPYIEFKSEGSFDCLNTKSINGTVTATIVNKKELTGGGGSNHVFMLPPAEKGDPAIHCEIKDNNLVGLDGNFNFLISDEGGDFFSGGISGSYKDGNINGSGRIELCRDIDLPKNSATFTLVKGSGGEATVTNNVIDTVTGDLTVMINAPNTEGSDGDTSSGIEVKSTGTVDVVNGKVQYFSGSASLKGDAFKLGESLSLTSLGATVTIEDDVLQEISGAASIEYKKNDFTISGACDSFSWNKAPEGGTDAISFDGNLNVTGMKGKLTGEAGIHYDSENGAPTVDGELTYKPNEWLTGKIGVRFENGWDDPILHGELNVENVTLVEGRQLMGVNKPNMFQVAANVSGVNLGAGVGLGFSVDLKPLTFNAQAAVEDFHIAKAAEGAVPTFHTDLSIESGVTARAAVNPYLFASIGLESVLSAGLRLKGSAALNASADATLTGSLDGGPEGLGGDIGLGFKVSGGLSLGLTPSVYAQLFGHEAEADLANFNFDLGNLFEFKWGKKIGFGSKEGEISDIDDVPSIDAAASTTIEQEKVGDENNQMSEYAPKGEQSAQKEDAPHIPSAKDIGQEAGQGKEGGEGGNQFTETIEQAKAVAKAVQNISKIVGFVVGLVKSAVAGGPAGMLVYLIVKLITDPGQFLSLPQKLQEIKDGVAALKALVASNADFIMDILPDWVKGLFEYIEILKHPQDHIQLVVDEIRKKAGGLGYPLSEIVQPLVDFVGKQADKICEIYNLFEKGGASNIIKGIFKILGFGFGGIIDLVKAVTSMWNIFSKIIRDAAARGDIWVKRTSYKFNIPGLYVSEGKSLGISTAIRGLLALV